MKKLTVSFLTIFVVLLVPWIRCALSQTLYLNEAVGYIEVGEYKQAVIELTRSVRFNAPFIQPSKAIYLLHDIAKNNQDSSVRHQALLALKSSLISTNQDKIDSDITLSNIENLIRSSYLAPEELVPIQEYPKPHYNSLIQINAGIVFITWVICACFSILRGIRSDGSINPKPLLTLVSLSIVLLAAWLGLLARA